MYPEALVNHLARTHSDHCPVLLCLDAPSGARLIRLFCFQPMWLSHPTFPDFVSATWAEDLSLKPNVEKFTRDVISWNKDVFGNIFHKKNRVEARLRGVQASIAHRPSEALFRLENQLQREFLDILKQEEEFWSVKSRYNWLIQGDRNTKFFHTSTLIRCKRNRISSLQDNQGNWVHDEQEVAELVRSGFVSLFSSESVYVPWKPWVIPRWSKGLNLEEASVLAVVPTSREVKEGLWSLKPLKAPGLDELHAGFFQAYWSVVGDNVIKEVKDIFTTLVMPGHLNKTLISLIPKRPRADCLAAFRPISLYNIVYKIVTKIIVKRMRNLLPNLISPLQTAFVPGRLGLDNMIIAQEIIHTISGKRGQVGTWPSK